MFKRKPPLFGTNISPACVYCAHWRSAVDDKLYLCPKSGVVAPYYKCKKFTYSPLRRIPKRQPKMPTFTAEDFML